MNLETFRPHELRKEKGPDYPGNACLSKDILYHEPVWAL